MNKSSAGFCKKLYDSIEGKYGVEKACEVCGAGVGSAASPAKKREWAAEAMGKMEACFGEGERAAIMAACACGPRKEQLEAAGKKYGKCRSLEELAEARNEEMQGVARYEARDGLLYVSYPQCYCAMVKNAENPVPRTWCLCSCEYTRRWCEAALGGPVEVKLLKSFICGDDECMFEVKVL